MNKEPVYFRKAVCCRNFKATSRGYWHKGIKKNNVWVKEAVWCERWKTFLLKLIGLMINTVIISKRSLQLFSINLYFCSLTRTYKLKLLFQLILETHHITLRECLICCTYSALHWTVGPRDLSFYSVHSRDRPPDSRISSHWRLHGCIVMKSSWGSWEEELVSLLINFLIARLLWQSCLVSLFLVFFQVWAHPTTSCRNFAAWVMSDETNIGIKPQFHISEAH